MEPFALPFMLCEDAVSDKVATTKLKPHTFCQRKLSLSFKENDNLFSWYINGSLCCACIQGFKVPISYSS